jgi:hypothetical protein
MRKSRDLLLSALFIAVVSLFNYTEAGAVADGNGSCSSAEDATSDCGQFGTGNVIEFRGTAAATCGSLPCTEYKYRYTGTSTNQIEILIPNTVLTQFTPGTNVAGCLQLVPSGVGDSTNGFGVNIVTHRLCKLPANLSSGTQFSVFADPSTAKPLSWEVSFGKTASADTVNGPAVPGDKIAETAATLTTSEGVSVSYTNVGGVITPTGGRVVPISGTKLCVVKPSAPSSPVFPNDYTCETISFATDQCDIKTTGTDPCRFIGGSALCY